MTKTTKTKFAMIKNPQFLANESLRSKLDDPSAFFVFGTSYLMVV